MATWDVFHSERLEVERGLDTARVRAALTQGDLNEDDLIRPAGSADPWTRIGDMPALLVAETEPPAEPPAAPPPPPAPPPPTAFAPTLADEPIIFRDLVREDDEDDENEDVAFIVPDDEPAPHPVLGPLDAGEHDVIPEPLPPPPPPPPPRGRSKGSDEPYSEFDLNLRGRDRDRDQGTSSVELVTDGDDGGLVYVDENDNPIEPEPEYDPLEEDEAVAEFTLSRSSTQRVEELDLAAMVDVAFQMVLFFLVTSTTILYKTLEVPKPNPESNQPAAATQGRSRSLDDLKDTYILVEIDPAGVVKIDHDPVPATLGALTSRLRAERDRTHRSSMLLSADFSTPHRSAVLAYDAANEIGLGIAIARPAPAGSAPPLQPAAPRAGAGPPL